MAKVIIGSEEWCSFPELGVPAIKARIDSGAATSTIHATNIEVYEKEGKKYVRFKVHPLQKNRKIVKLCDAPLHSMREIKSSSGHKEKRPIILTPLTIGQETWEVEVTLTNRDNMGYRMLLGRQAMAGKFLVDPDASFVITQSIDSEISSLYQLPSKKFRSLKIVVLASNSELYSNKRIIEAGLMRGHEMIFLNVKECYINISSSKPVVHYRGGQIIEDIDAVIPRIRPAMTFYGGSILRQFEVMGAFCLNHSISLTVSRDKLKSLQLLRKKGIPMPTTGFANSPQNTKDLIKMVGGAPLVVKLLEGTQGMGVVLAETQNAAESVINAFKSLKANILVQEYIKESKGKDLRCFVIDNKVVGSIERIAASENEFRANIHLGGKALLTKISAEERKLAVKSAKALGLKVAGVDILRSNDGPKILEVNSSPGLEGIEGATGKDIASMMIDCIEENLLQ